MAKKKKLSNSIQYTDGQNLHDINAQDEHIKKYQSEILNLVNKHGHGNDADIVGMVSQLIKVYRDSTKNPSLEGWKEFHTNLSDIEGIEVGVQKNLRQFQEMKKAINEIDEETLRYWLQNLVYNKTFAGLQAQDMILKDIAERMTKKEGVEYKHRNGDADDEGAQIDGYIISPNGKVCGLQVKSDSYRSHNTIEGSAPVQYVYYELNSEKLNYAFELEDLEFVDESVYEGFKEAAKEREREKKRKKEEKEKKEAERARRKEEREKMKAEKEAEKARRKEEREKKKAERELKRAGMTTKNSTHTKE